MAIRQAVKRKLIQIAAFGLSNIHVCNMKTGKLYTGKWKRFCNPGLHCYSCPAASVSCPIGALQVVSGSMNFKFSFYVVGFLLAAGVLFGRFICGFICPFGLVQELLHKIPSPKCKLPKWVKYIKYVILVVFVLILPIAVTNAAGMGAPAFCKYICPSGTLFGAVPLLSTHPELKKMLGALFSLKAVILGIVIIGSVFVFRFFCKVLCPLGAIYGLLNKVSFYHLEIDKEKCISCGKCAKACHMDINPVKTPNSMECIRCGACREKCPTGAIQLGFHIKKKQTEQEENDG